MQQFTPWRFLLAVGMSGWISPHAVAIEGNVIQESQVHNPYSARRIDRNPFLKIEPAPVSGAFRMAGDIESMGLEDATRNQLYTQGLWSGFQVISHGMSKNPRGRQHADFHLEYHGQPLCQSFVRAHLLGKALWVGGEVPDGENIQPWKGQGWPSADKVQAWMFQSQPTWKKASTVVTPCWWISEREEMEPAYELHILDKAEPKRVIAGDKKLFLVERSSFSLQASAMATVQSYEKDPVDGKLVTESIAVSDPTRLRNQYFSMDNGPYAEIASADHMFVFDPENAIPFTEANTFAAANRYFQWLLGIQYEWSGEQVTIQLHQLVMGTPNNALFMPGYGDSWGPTIEIGDGDGKVLQNLPLDRDVVTHEFSHNVIFRALRSTDQEEDENEILPPAELNHSLAIHEGLADSFTFLYTDSPCLGESICPVGSRVCAVPGQCLRTADNDLRYDGAAYWAYGSRVHMKGQLVSGLIWDLRKEAFLPLHDLAVFLNASVDYLLPKSTYQDLLLALLSADYELHRASHCTQLLAAAQARGFSGELVGIDCANAASIVATKNARETVVDNASTGVVTSTQTESANVTTSSKNPFCGMALGSGKDQPLSGGWLWFLLGLPLTGMVPARRGLRKLRSWFPNR